MKNKKNKPTTFVDTKNNQQRTKNCGVREYTILKRIVEGEFEMMQLYNVHKKNNKQRTKNCGVIEYNSEIVEAEFEMMQLYNVFCVSQ